MRVLVLSLMMIWLLSSCSPKDGEGPPNIVIILADDLGYGDLACYNPNSLIPTPNLDKLAAEGIRLSRAYCPVSVCSPSRYALMTGQYPWRSWRKSGVMRNYEPSMIKSELLSLPEMLQQAGFTTAGFGKWHLGTTFPTLDGNQPAGYGKFRADDNGANLDLTKPVSDGPLAHGFDHWLGFSCASECWILDGNTISGAIGHELYTIEATPNQDHIEVIPLEDYLPFITEEALSFLHEQATSTSDQPFFLYFAPYVPHIPLSVSAEFRGRTEAGLYGDYVHELDDYLGKILDALERLSLEENTIVLFASDNGSQFERTSNKIDFSQASNSPTDQLIDQDSFPAHYPNAPLRGTKWSIYEGGVRTPFIARWPGHFPAGMVSDQLFGLNDVMATLSAVIDFDETVQIGRDSHNFLPNLEGTGQLTREEIVVQSSGGAYGIVQGKWKYIGLGNYKAPEGTALKEELYDLSEDESEAINLIETYPRVAEKLKSRLEALIQDDVLLNEE